MIKCILAFESEARNAKNESNEKRRNGFFFRRRSAVNEYVNKCGTIGKSVEKQFRFRLLCGRRSLDPDQSMQNNCRLIFEQRSCYHGRLLLFDHFIVLSFRLKFSQFRSCLFRRNQYSVFEQWFYMLIYFTWRSRFLVEGKEFQSKLTFVFIYFLQSENCFVLSTLLSFLKILCLPITTKDNYFVFLVSTLIQYLQTHTCMRSHQTCNTRKSLI